MARNRTAKKTKKYWSKTVEELGQRIRIYERAATDVLWYSVIQEDASGRKKQVRGSLKTTDRSVAEDNARQVARKLVEEELIPTDGDAKNRTLGEVFAAYFKVRAPALSGGWRKEAQSRRNLFEACWGKDKLVVDIGQDDVDHYCRQRRAGTLTPLGPGKGRGSRKPVKVRDGTLENNFRWLATVFNWGMRYKVGGKRFLSENPLHDVEVPKENNPRRPVASHQRFLKTLEHVDAVDPKGRLRAILCLARYTGRREGAICGLMASDLLLTPQRVRTALAEAGMDERIADHMPHGAVRWSDQSDKMGYLFISPLSEPAREALNDYLKQNPRGGDVPLFPAPKDRDKCIRNDFAGRWLLKAEKLAEQPKLRGGIFHPYRRLWASERKHLPDTDVAAGGGWKDTRAMKQSYQQADPATVLQVVENVA